MKVVSPATTSVLRFVPRSENLKKVPKVSISPLPAYVRHKYSNCRLQVSWKATGIRFSSCETERCFRIKVLRFWRAFVDSGVMRGSRTRSHRERSYLRAHT